MSFFKKRKLKKQKIQQEREQYISDHRDELLQRKFPYITQGVDKEFRFTGQNEVINYGAISYLEFIELVKRLPSPPPDYDDDPETETPPHVCINAKNEILSVSQIEHSKWLVYTDKIKIDRFMHKNGQNLYNLDNIKKIVEYIWVRC